MSGMLGLIGQGPQSDPEVQARRADLIPGSTGDVLGAAVSEAFSDSPGPRMARVVARGYVDQGDGTYAPLNATDELGLPTGLLPPSPMVPLATLKEQYDIPGVLSFDKDTPQSVAQSLYDHKVAQMRRAQVLGRADNMLTQGAAARFVASMIGSIADPVNLAAMFVPGVNEATAARMLAVGAGASALERAGVRALTGATQGAAGMAALEPLNYALSRQERDDWTMSGALLNVLLGTVAGAGLHSGMGALLERSRGLPDWAPARVASERIQAASPEVQQALGRGAVAAQAEGRPFEASAILDLSENLEAAQQIRRLADAQTRIEADAAQEMAAVRAQREQAGRRNTPAEAAARSGDMAERLRAEVDSLQADVERVRQRVLTSGMDAETVGRLEAADAELAGTIPAARRRALEAERTMLMEGRGTLDTGSAGELSVARDAAELKGLQAALDRATAGADRAEAAMAVAAKEAEVVAGQRAVLAKAADAGERAAMARLEVRQAGVDANAARTMRQIAGALDSRLSPQQALELGRAVARGQATLADAVAAIERWKTDNVAITPESLSGELTNADLLARADRLEQQARTAFQQATAQPVDPTAAQPPPPASRTGLAPPDPKPPSEPGAAARNLSDVEKQTKALDDLIRLMERRAPEPPRAPGTAMRLYRGEGAGAVGRPGEAAFPESATTGGWFTTSIEKARKYGGVSYVDVTRDELMGFAQGHGGADEWVTSNPKFRAAAKPLDAGGAMAERLKAYDALVDEETRVDAAVFETVANCIVRR